MPEPEAPKPVRLGKRLFFDRHEVENYKRRLLGLPLLERDEREPIELVSARQFSEELGRSRRTLGRRIYDIMHATEVAAE
jgi:hypothetical protein